MGCDIHLHAEIKIDGTWHHYSHVSVPRSYKLFSIMAGVRGNETPIAQPRGVPSNCSTVTRLDYEEWRPDAHSASYLTAEEIADLSDRMRRDPLLGDESDYFGYFLTTPMPVSRSTAKLRKALKTFVLFSGLITKKKARGGMLTPTERHLINRVQKLDLPTALVEADSCLSCYKHASRLTKDFWKALGFACLNRACELACVPLHTRLVDTACVSDEMWYSYRVGYFADFEHELEKCPECEGSGMYICGYDGYGEVSWECEHCDGKGTINVLVPVRSGYEPQPFAIGYRHLMSESEARSKALGW